MVFVTQPNKKPGARSLLWILSSSEAVYKLNGWVSITSPMDYSGHVSVFQPYPAYSNPARSLIYIIMLIIIKPPFDSHEHQHGCSLLIACFSQP